MAVITRSNNDLTKTLTTPELYGILTTADSTYCTSKYSDLTALNTVVGSNSCTIIVDSTVAVSADTTIGTGGILTGASIVVQKGGGFTVATTKTLTINAPFSSGLFQCFTCTGTGKVVFGSGAVTEVYPEWWSITNDATGIQKALDCVATTGGVVKLAPREYDISTTTLTLGKYTTLSGSNMVGAWAASAGTKIKYSGSGNAIENIFPVNSNVGVWSKIENLGVYCLTSSVGAGIAQVGGSEFSIYNVYVTGFKYGIVFDQTEISAIDLCHIVSVNGGAGVWLVNGSDFTASALPFYTNRITITRCQFNSEANAIANILDDGGINHTIDNNNFNAGLIAVRASAVYGLVISNNESEVHGTADIYLADTTQAGTYVGACHAPEISGNTLISGATSNIAIQNCKSGTINSNTFAQAGNIINFLNPSTNSATGIIIEGNSKELTGVAKTAAPFINGLARNLANNFIRQTAMTYSTAAVGATGSQTITPASMEFIRVGTRLRLHNTDGTNAEDVIVTAATGSTFTTTLASTKSADFSILGITSASETEGQYTPVLYGSSTAGTNTYSTQTGYYHRIGDLVNVKGLMVVSAKGAMSGQLCITLPFTLKNIVGIDSTAVIAFSGITMASHTSIVGSLAAGNNYIGLLKQGSGAAIGTLQATDIAGTTCLFQYDITYSTSS